MANEFPITPGQHSTALSGPAESSRTPGQPSTSVATTSVMARQFSKKRLALAFAIAGISDAISAFTALWPPIAWGVDLVTAILLFAILGWRWLLLPGLVLEAIPGVGVVPFWVLVVAAIAVWGTARPKLK
jgi:MFS family permease